LFRGGDEAPPTSGDGNATTSPFGTPDSTLPAAQPDFEGEVPALSGAQVGEAGESHLKLFEIESAPVAGFVALSHGSTTVVRYAERATGNIFDARLPDLEKTRLTNETIPQVYEAYFRTDGSAVLYRTLDAGDTIKNMSLTLTAPKASSSPFYQIAMTLLQGDLDGISVGKGDSLSYVAKNAGSVNTSTFDGESARTLWSGPFTSWRTTSWGPSLLLFTKPSFALPGYAYSVSSGNLTKLVGPLYGLIATPNPAGTYLIYSYTSGGVTALAAQSTNGVAVSFAPATLADKCVGSAKEKASFVCGVPSSGVYGEEPDAWYQGKVHFSDDIWKFDAAAQSASLVLEPETIFGVPVDVSLPALSADEHYLIFVNARDLSLWAAELK
jgi:hypothetical protein